jgi:dihydroorotase
MTLYLTDQTSAAEIKKAHTSGIVKAVKLYPAGATTNSDSGVTDIAKVAHALCDSDLYASMLLLQSQYMPSIC